MRHQWFWWRTSASAQHCKRMVQKQRYVGQSHQTPSHDYRKHGSCVFLSDTKINWIVWNNPGITVDDRLCFDEHVSNICKKITNQFNVISRFRKLIPATVLLRLHKAFILPHFLYCSTVWHFCDCRNKDKIEMLNKRVLRVILNDKVSSYGDLLQRIGH